MLTTFGFMPLHLRPEDAGGGEPPAPAPADQPTPTDATPTEGPGSTGEPSFTEAYDPSSLPEEARGAYDAAYKRLQADYTRKLQGVSEQRQQADTAMALVEALQNPDTQAQALEYLGLELDDQGEPVETPEAGEPVDDVAELKQWREQLDAERAEQTRQQELQFYQDYIDQQIAEKAQALNLGDLSDEDKEDIFALVLATPAVEQPGGQPLPNVEDALKRFQSSRDRWIKGYRESKDAPAPPEPGGGSGEPAPSLSDPRARRAAALVSANQAFGPEG